MKLTHILYKQHIGRHFKKHWWVQSFREIKETPARATLEQLGKTVYDPKDIIPEQYPPPEDAVEPPPKPAPLELDPNWHSRICYTYKDNNVLLEGLNQAKILTNAVTIKEGLPEKILLNDVDKSINRKVMEIVRSSHLFDAEQKKLPKIKDPLRPAWNFPRIYGITETRVNKLITSKLLQLIELNSELELTSERMMFNDLYFSYPFEKKNNLIQFELRGDMLLTSSNPLDAVCNEKTDGISLPDIYPSRETITLNKDHIYELKNFYPIDTNIRKCHPHTLIVYHNHTEVGNLFAEEVTTTQIQGRTLLKAFTVGAAYAKQLYGETGKLEKPVTIQCIQTDGKQFHFGVLQINSLDLLGEEKNVWYQTETMQMFTNCAYVSGRPILEGYNSDVIKHFIGFYNNV